MDLQSFSTYFANRRKEVGLKESDIAESLCYTIQAVSKWETGLSYPDLSILGQLAKLFKVDFDALILLRTTFTRENDYVFNGDDFGKFIKLVRKTKKLSQGHIAKKTGVTYQTVTKWEKGISLPNLEQFVKLCEEFKLTPSTVYYANRSGEFVVPGSFQRRRYAAIAGGAFGVLLVATGISLGVMGANGVFNKEQPQTNNTQLTNETVSTSTSESTSEEETSVSISISK